MESRHGPLSPDSPFLLQVGLLHPRPLRPPTVGLGQGLRAGLPCCGWEAEWGASPAGEEPGSRARSSGGRGQERGARAAKRGGRRRPELSGVVEEAGLQPAGVQGGRSVGPYLPVGSW